MFVKLDQDVVELLCCPLCKSNLAHDADHFLCISCGLVFPSIEILVGRNIRERVCDFRIHRPAYCVPDEQILWGEVQREFETCHDRSAHGDALQLYLDEIDSVREIYREEFHIGGSILDVGGHQGRLRHFLDSDVSLYVSIDPFINVFDDVADQKSLIEAYPCLTTPCNFIAAQAEYLPFRSKVFDWIHMRSVVDHLSDPYQALIEAFRCCKTGGHILIGLAIMEKLQSCSREEGNVPLTSKIVSKLKRDGVAAFLDAVKRKVSRKDDHMVRLSYNQLLDLLDKSGWQLVKEHWQKPPYSYCIYVSAAARSVTPRSN